MCNNSPAKATSSENEWRSRVQHTPSGFRYVDDCGDTLLWCLTRLRLSHVEGYQGALPSLRGGVGTDAFLAKAEAEATLDADLGCSSSYSIGEWTKR